MPAGALCLAHARCTSRSRSPGPQHRRHPHERQFDHVRTGPQLVTAITDLILGRVGGTARDPIITFEVYQDQHGQA